MYSDWAWSAIGGFLAVWLLGLTFLIWQQNKFLRSLFPKSGNRDIRRKFEEVLRQVFDLRQDLERVKGHLSEVEQIGLRHVQRVALIRFNPYDDTGGDQSFSLALLDDQGNGIVITSLHARSSTRIFAKPIHLGKGTKYRLSEEEQQVVGEAMRRMRLNYG